MSKKRLLIVSDEQLLRGRDGYYVTNPLVALFESLTAYFERVTICARTRSEAILGGRRVEIDVLPRPYYRSFADFVMSPHLWYQTYRTLLSGLGRSDMVLLRLPSPVAPMVLSLSSRLRKPVSVLIVSDLEELGRAKKAQAGCRLLGTLKLCFASTLDLLQRRISDGRRVLVTGTRLKERYEQHASEILSIVPSTISREDLFLRVFDDKDTDTPVRLLSVGRITREKGIDVLLNAAKRLRNEGFDVEVSIVGDGPARVEMEALAKTLRMDESVRFLGYIGDRSSLHNQFDSADIFVLPSLSEGLPKVLVEAMARSLAVVATDVGSIRDVIIDRDTGLLVRPGDIDGLVSAIKLLIEQPNMRRDIGHRAYRMAARYLVDNEARRIAEFLLKVAT